MSEAQLVARYPSAITVDADNFISMRASLFIAVVLTIVCSGCATRGLYDENARPVTPVHYRAQRMRVEGGYGPAYYLADTSGSLRIGTRRPYAVIDVGYANPLWSWMNRRPNWAD